MDAAVRVRSLPLLLVAATSALLLAACSTAARGDPALPAGLAAHGMVDAEASIYMMLTPEAPVEIPADLFGQSGPDPLSIVGIEALANALPEEFAARFEFTSEAAARAAHQLAIAHSQPAWADVEGRFLAISASSGAWADALREVWKSGTRTTMEERYPAEWEALRLLPEAPPSPPVAAGFARNLGDVMDAVLSAGEVEVPGLSNALGLIRVEQVAFGAYAPALTALPSSISPATLRDSGIGVIAAAESTYPGFVINFLASRFKGRAGLEETTVADRTVLERDLEGQAHLMVVNYGPTFYFAIAPTRAGSLALIESVIESQGTRS